LPFKKRCQRNQWKERGTYDVVQTTV